MPVPVCRVARTMDDQKIMFEFEPVTQSDNTEVKVPVVSHTLATIRPTTPSVPDPVSTCGDINSYAPNPGSALYPSSQDGAPCDDADNVDQTQCSLQAGQVFPSSPLTSTADTSNARPSEDDDILALLDTTHLDEYNNLISLFKKLASDKFINRILVDYHSDEQELDRLRSLLFDALRAADDCPLDTNCELKQRKHTRYGESVPVKLAKDIHVIISVLEGEDYSVLNDLVSKGKQKTRKSVVIDPLTPSGNTCSNTVPMKPDNSVTNLLNDKICGLETELLVMKQRQIAVESARSDEFKSVKKTITDIKLLFQQFSQDMISKSSDIKDMIKTSIEKCDSAGTKASDAKTITLKMAESLVSLQNQVMEICAFIQFPTMGSLPFSLDENDPETMTPPTSAPDFVTVPGELVDENSDEPYFRAEPIPFDPHVSSPYVPNPVPSTVHSVELGVHLPSQVLCGEPPSTEEAASKPARVIRWMWECSLCL